METSKNSAQVVIDGRVITLSGYESEEYLQKVAAYLNNKIAECVSVPGFRRQNAELRSILISLNIADDYFKSKRQGTILEEEIEAKDKELYDIKHELISAQLKLEQGDKATEKLKVELEEARKQLVKLETELETIKKSEEQAKAPAKNTSHAKDKNNHK